MGRHWSALRSGTVARAQPPNRYRDLVLIREVGQPLATAWSQNEAGDDVPVIVRLYADTGTWEEFDQVEVQSAGEEGCVFTFYAGEFGCPIKATLENAPYPTLESPIVQD